MKYTRKTEDEYQLWVMYDGQWEEVAASNNRKEVIADKKAYLANDHYMQNIKIIKKRVKKDVVNVKA